MIDPDLEELAIYRRIDEINRWRVELERLKLQKRIYEVKYKMKTMKIFNAVAPLSASEE